MIITFFDLEDESNKLNGTSFEQSSALIQALETLRQKREPFVCELNGENGYHLTAGIGPWGCVQHSRIDGELPYLMAVANMGLTSGEIEFLMGGTATPIDSRYCMPFERLMEIVRFFQETGERSPDVAWDSV